LVFGHAGIPNAERQLTVQRAFGIAVDAIPCRESGGFQLRGGRNLLAVGISRPSCGCGRNVGVLHAALCRHVLEAHVGSEIGEVAIAFLVFHDGIGQRLRGGGDGIGGVQVVIVLRGGGCRGRECGIIVVGKDLLGRGDEVFQFLLRVDQSLGFGKVGGAKRASFIDGGHGIDRALVSFAEGFVTDIGRQCLDIGIELHLQAVCFDSRRVGKCPVFVVGLLADDPVGERVCGRIAGLRDGLYAPHIVGKPCIAAVSGYHILSAAVEMDGQSHYRLVGLVGPVHDAEVAGIGLTGSEGVVGRLCKVSFQVGIAQVVAHVGGFTCGEIPAVGILMGGDGSVAPVGVGVVQQIIRAVP